MGCALKLDFHYENQRDWSFFEDKHRTEYMYDGRGNLIAKNPKNIAEKAYRYEYTSLNQLSKFSIFSDPFGSVLESYQYNYDILGRRISKAAVVSQNSVRTISTFRYDGPNVIFEWQRRIVNNSTVSNALVASYTYSPYVDDILAVNVTPDGASIHKIAKAPGTYLFLKDHIGSITDVTDSLGEVVQRYAYSSFGKVLRIVDSTNNDITNEPNLNSRYQFAGREFDFESNLYFNRARMYDSSIGRFIQQDPAPGELQSPLSVINKYIYGNNNPNTFTDPTGKVVIFGVVIAVVQIIGIVVGLVSAITSASLNYDSARKAGLSDSAASVSAFFAFVFSFAAGYLSVTNPGLSPLWTGMASGLTNMTNQLISNGNNWDNINWTRVGASAGASALMDAFTGFFFRGLGVKGDINLAILGFNAGSLGGFCVDSGFGASAEWSCGIQLLAPEQGDNYDRSQPSTGPR